MRAVFAESLPVLLLLGSLAATGCDDSDAAPDAGLPVPADLAEQLDRLIAENGVPSISVGILRDGALVSTVTRGLADVEGDRPATPETIYGLASCSKPVVGLATALLIDEQPAVDLDGDVNDWLEWDPPLAHPEHPGVPITLRMLLRHTAGITSDSDDDYDTYPKPDPDVDLEGFLRPLLAEPASWVGRPGAREDYSNLGIALAALVVERAAGMDFRRFCEARIFDPLQMSDTRWFYGDLSSEQHARHAIPHDLDGEPYEIYGFNDYPSGLLRSTVPDFARLMGALAGGGRLDGAQVLPAAAVRLFHDEALAIVADEDGPLGVFEHSGSEAGVGAYFVYRTDGAGYLFMMNGELDDGPLDAFELALDDLLGAAAGLY